MFRLIAKVLWILPCLLACAHQQTKIFSSVSDLFQVIFYQKSLIDLPEWRRDSQLAVYIPQFLQDAESQGHPISQEMQNRLRQLVYVDQLSVPADPGVMAACSRYYATEFTISGTSELKWMNIEVLRKESQLFTKGDVFLLRELVYHELFHCYMNKGHLPEGYSGIMSPTLDPSSTLVHTDWQGLVDEMFSEKYLALIPDAS